MTQSEQYRLILDALRSQIEKYALAKYKYAPGTESRVHFELMEEQYRKLYFEAVESGVCCNG